MSIPDCYRAANCQPIIVLLAPEDDPDTNQGCKSFEAVGCAPRGSCGQETSTLRRQDGRCFHYTTLCPPPGIPDLANQEHYDQESIDNGCLLNRYTGRYGPMAAPICADSLDRILNNPEGMEARKGQFLPYQGIFELNPFVLHSRTFGGTGQDIPVQVVENAAKDLLILAMEVDQDKVQKRTHLLVLQPDGEEKADYTLSDSFADSALSFALSTRGTEVIVFGRTTSPSPQSRLLWLLLVDTAGKVKWRKDFSGDWGNDTASFLVSENRDMTILASRDPQDDSSDDAGLCLFHTDGVGEEQWRTCFGTTTRLEESRDAMVETMDGYVVLGAEKAGDEAQPGILLTKISPAGQIVWSTPFHLPSPLVPKMLLPAQDHGFYVLAVSVDPVFPSSGIILLKFNQDGNAVWSRTIKLEGAFGDAFEFSTWDALSLHAAEDEELVLIAREQVSSSHYNAAETESMLRIAYLDSMGKILTSSGSRCSKDYLFSISKEHSYTMLCSRQERWLNNGKDIVLLSVDELGHVRIDHASYGSQQDDTAMSMLSQADGSLLIVGTTSDLGAGMSDIVLFRIGTHGRIVPLR
ncbi:MAG: hypothetical protein A2284_10750 [Deltaproteobacteria bacterium RIFOXYA12_FULL_61_11]|nr:MAG: hypothetical protein A2284_10750 [Deltaproteobacteria bacterium RIFOXYA12_FULL_61_11]